MNVSLGKLSFNKRNELRMVSRFQQTHLSLIKIANKAYSLNCPEEEWKELNERRKQLQKAAFKLQQYAMEYAK